MDKPKNDDSVERTKWMQSNGSRGRRSHYGSPLPRYYTEGKKIWGSWVPRPRVSRQGNRRDLSICMPSGMGRTSGSAERLFVRWRFNMDHRAGLVVTR
jgi:hypothetical protein